MPQLKLFQQTLQHLTPEERAKAFKSRFPQYAGFIVHNGAIYTTWVIGNLYRRRTGFYGEFPHSVRERILALFPDKRKILHLFSGTIRPSENEVTYDINPKLKPTICDDVRNILNHKDELKDIDLVVADPPYEAKDFERYGQKPFSKSKVIADLATILKPKACLAWLDVMVPIWSKQYWSLIGVAGIVVSTNTRMRVLLMLERIEK